MNYTETEDLWICGYCGDEIHKGEIVQIHGRWVTPEWHFKTHMEGHDPFTEMMKKPRSVTGLTEVQEMLLPLLHQGLHDEEIAKELKISKSTVRNHRFRLREKEKQAKLFLQLMSHLNLQKEEVMEPHKGATMVDDRYHATEGERQKVLATYLTAEGALISFPAKEKRKLVVLREISEYFKEGRKYTEKDVNQILSRVFEDYVLLRRYLIEYGFLDRTKDGSVYMRR